MKLENRISKFVALAPKVYYMITENGSKIIKIKGVSKEHSEKVSWEDFLYLLRKDSVMEFEQEKWINNLLGGSISIRNIVYTLKVTSNKRECIFEDNLFVATRPYNYEDLEAKSTGSAQPLAIAAPEAVEEINLLF